MNIEAQKKLRKLKAEEIILKCLKATAEKQ